MAGPTAKHPSRRARRNNPTAGFTTLSADGRTGDVPEWPLPEDSQANTLVFLEDKVANLTAQLLECDDARKRGGFKRQLDNAEKEAALLKIQIEQQYDLELELWSLLWSTPQAKMWEESAAYVRALAQFVRWNVKGEQGDLKAAAEARIRGKDFGLTPLTLMGLKAEIERADEAEERGSRRRERTAPAPNPAGDDPRGGLYAVS